MRIEIGQSGKIEHLNKDSLIENMIQGTFPRGNVICTYSESSRMLPHSQCSTYHQYGLIVQGAGKHLHYPGSSQVVCLREWLDTLHHRKLKDKPIYKPFGLNSATKI